MQKYLDKKLIVVGNQPEAIQATLDFDYVLGKEKPSILAIIDTNTKVKIFNWGAENITIPVFKNLQELKKVISINEIWGAINFTSSRNVLRVTKQLLDLDIKNIFILAENVAERDTRFLRQLSKEKNINIVGPSSVGVLYGGQLKISHAGGLPENFIREKLFVGGEVAIISKSGGMLNELMSMVTRSVGGIYMAKAIGGDRFPIENLKEAVEKVSKEEGVKMILVLGEVGGTQENELAEYLQKNKINPKVVVHILGGGAKNVEIQFGHAGAMANSDVESVEYKNQILEKAGAVVVKDFANLKKALKEEASKLEINTIEDVTPNRNLPDNFKNLLRTKKVRHTPEILSSFDYNYSQGAKQTMGKILFELWFRRKADKTVGDFMDLVLKTLIDHGPEVSGAINTIITSRAGKDMVSSLASGLLTIGPRFGGAINEAGKNFYRCLEENISPENFVKEMKDKNVYIPGIGHRVKSKTNPDDRVEMFKKYAKKNFISRKFLDFSLNVEKITTAKKDNLILNVDGVVAAIMLDIFTGLKMTNAEILQILNAEGLNALFIYARSAGFIAHYLDQKYLDQPLYRHPEWDVLKI